jgi:hypothetical protein
VVLLSAGLIADLRRRHEQVEVGRP